MYADKQIIAVIPAYNEEVLIHRVIETMPDYVDKIIVVDDCSTDKTCDVLESLRQSCPERLFVIRHATNQGVGGSIATGYKWCVEQGADIAVVMAGDGQMHPSDLPALLKPVVSGKVDFAKGNRLFTGDAWNQIPRVRYLGNSAMSLLTKIASGYWQIADSQCGYTAINREALTTINWNKMYKRYGQPNDLLVRLNIYNFRVCDVKVKPVYNIGEKSGIKPIRMIPRLFTLLSKLYFYRMWEKYVIRDFHPLVLFYSAALGLLLFLFPLLFLRMCIVWGSTGSIPPINALAVIVVFLTGLQLLLFAMWFDMEANRDLNRRNPDER